MSTSQRHGSKHLLRSMESTTSDARTDGRTDQPQLGCSSHLADYNPGYKGTNPSYPSYKHGYPSYKHGCKLLPRGWLNTKVAFCMRPRPHHSPRRPMRGPVLILPDLICEPHIDQKVKGLGSGRTSTKWVCLFFAALVSSSMPLATIDNH